MPRVSHGDVVERPGGNHLFGRTERIRLPEAERIALVGALSAMASSDGPATMDETLAILARFDLDEVSPDGIAAACDAVVSPPPVDAALQALATVPEDARVQVLAELLLVARVDTDGLVPAEAEVFEKARAALGVDERGVRRAEKRVLRERWERAHGLARAERLDNVRNVLVLLAGFGVPLAAIFGLGLERQPDLRLALVAGVDALGAGYGPLAGVLVAMALSVGSSVALSFLTLRGRFAERLYRDRVLHADRTRANLSAVVDRLTARVRQMQAGDARQRSGVVALENRLQTYLKTLLRLRSVG